jgi:hypothetical protein
MKTKRITVAALLAVLGLLAVSRHYYAGSTVPAGQPALLSLDAQNFDQVRRAFNAASGNVRVVLLLSPT